MGALSAAVMFLFAPQAIALMLGTGSGLAFTEAVKYLRLVSDGYVRTCSGEL